MPSPHLTFALLVSILLHLAVLLPRQTRPAHAPAVPAVTPAVLETVLQPAPVAVEPLLKNTLDTQTKIATSPPPPLPAPLPKKRGIIRQPAQESAARKLAAHVFYPAEAVAQGWEGEVRLLLTLDDRGNVKEVDLAASSGHPVLDQAAIRAARTMRRLPGVDRHELILPVVFRLRP